MHGSWISGKHLLLTGSIFCLAISIGFTAGGEVGKIAGTVSDGETGWLLPRTVLLIEGINRESITDEDGFYFFLDVAVGRYNVTARRKGYEALTMPDIQVEANRTVTANFQLKPIALSLQQKGLPWPVKGQITSGEIKRKGDKNSEKILKGALSLFILAVEGADVAAMADGIVEKTEENNSHYRNYVAIRHPNGCRSIYANTGRNMVRAGDKVKAGQVIATVGRHSLEEPAFLGVGMDKGEAGQVYIDPLLYLSDNGRFDNPRVFIATSLWLGKQAAVAEAWPEFEVISSFWELPDRLRLDTIKQVFHLGDIQPLDGKVFVANIGQTLRYSTELCHYDGITLEITPEDGGEEALPIRIRMSKDNNQILSTRIVTKMRRSYVLAGPFPGSDDSFFLTVQPELKKVPSLESIQTEVDPEVGPPAFVAYDTPPELVEKVTPAYPEEAKRNKVEGTVWLNLWITKEGRVRKVRFIRGPELLREASEKAAYKMKFTPAKREGQPVEVWVTIPFKFALDDQKK